MARQPAHLKPRKGLRGRDALWASMRELKTFTALDLEGQTAQSLQTIRTYLLGLERAGYIEKIEERQVGYHATSYKSAVWQMIRDIGIEAPRVTKSGAPVTQGQGRENMWRSMKILRDFDYVDLAVHASTEETPVAHHEARDYINYLHKAGYLLRTKPAKPGNKPGTGEKARYRFLKARNTGPLPPMIQRIKQVYDQNLGEVVWTPGGDA